MIARARWRGFAAQLVRPFERSAPAADPQATADPEPCGAHRGQILVMFAFFLVSLLGMLGLATDLGFAFAARRAVQGAADAGAMAGARQIARYTITAPTSARTEVQSVVGANSFSGITPSLTYCKYIGNNWSEVGDCSSTVPSTAAGARVRTRATVPTFFIQVVPGAPNSVTVSGYAKARVQKANFTAPDGPFIVCGPHSWAVINVAGVPINSDIPIWVNGKINQLAVGVTYRIWDPKISNPSDPFGLAAGCKTKGARFNGLNDQTANAGKSVNQWFTYLTGTRTGPTKAKVNGVQGCNANTPEPYNCVMVLPIATDNPEETNNSKQVYIVGWAAFYVTSAGNNKANGRLMDDYVVTGPGTDGWCRDCGGVTTIRLIW